MHLRLLNAATATNSPPSGATAGFSLRELERNDVRGWLRYNSGVIQVGSTAGSATMTVTLRLWCYSDLLAKWLPLGTHATESLRGVLNEGNAIDEDGADNIVHAEMVTGLAAFSRAYLEITAIGGTNTAITAYLVSVGE